MLPIDDFPMIRDMTKPCKGCLCVFYPEDINKDGLCQECAKNGITPKDIKPLDDFDNW